MIPALNEESSIGRVLSAIPNWVDEVVVADNGSQDRTAQIAREGGAHVVAEPRRGYGNACMAAIGALDDPDIIVFLDGDFSDYPEEMDSLVDPITRDEADMVAGSRVLGQRESGALTPQARFGNWLACLLVRLFWQAKYTDLGPFRAIRSSTLKGLSIKDPNYGWVIEMQIKATIRDAKVLEVPVSYRRRIGRSKVSGTIRGVIGAGTKILLTIFQAALGLLDRDPAGEPTHRAILFTRHPEPGRTKTRLIPALGPEGAADLHRKMTEHTMSQIQQLGRASPVSVEIRHAGGSRELMREWLGRDLTIRNQGNGDLGVRMKRAFHDAFQEGINRAIIVGSDCPGLTADLMRLALEALSESEVVLGPASDGGYYLIGLRREHPQLFQDMPWGTETVLETSLHRIELLGLSKTLLEPHADIDRPEDLPTWENFNSGSG